MNEVPSPVPESIPQPVPESIPQPVPESIPQPVSEPLHAPVSTTATAEEAEALIEQARNEAQERVAELHNEEGSVRSEGAQNSPSSEDVDPVASATKKDAA